jgi:hypothetical protein
VQELLVPERRQCLQDSYSLSLFSENHCNLPNRTPVDSFRSQQYLPKRLAPNCYIWLVVLLSSTAHALTCYAVHTLSQTCCPSVYMNHTAVPLPAQADSLSLQQCLINFKAHFAASNPLLILAATQPALHSILAAGSSSAEFAALGPCSHGLPLCRALAQVGTLTLR